jgi:hypothetical protein
VHAGVNRLLAGPNRPGGQRGRLGQAGHAPAKQLCDGCRARVLACLAPTTPGAPDLLLRCGRGAMLILSAHSSPLSGQSCNNRQGAERVCVKPFGRRVKGWVLPSGDSAEPVVSAAKPEAPPRWPGRG